MKSLHFKICTILFLLLVLLSPFLINLTPSYAEDEVEVLQKQITELNKAREQSVAATKPLQGQLISLKNQRL